MAESTQDPVCEKTAAAHAERAGRTYDFCSQACHQKFTAEPSRYAK
jgi:YHS domain-containing protein